MMLLNSLLKTIVQDRDLHARWLNTFSFLEYIGFRKIIKSQDAETFSLSVLLHANEESRHALMLKKLALKMGGDQFDNYSFERLLCGPEAETYFQTIDAAADLLGDTKKAYLAVTWLIEVRALDVYKTYLEALRLAPRDTVVEAIEASLRALLKEEDRHLSDVESNDEFAATPRPVWLERLRQVEQRAYDLYLAHVARSLNVAAPFELAHA